MSMTEFKIVFFGMGQYTIGCLDAVIKNYNIVGIVQSVRKKKKYSAFDLLTVKHGRLQRFANEHNIPFMYTDDLNSDEVIDFLVKCKCNIVCVASAGQLLKGEILEVPKYGILNAHSSLLPDYRGANPTYWVFRNQEKVGGVTIHYIDRGMDTGNYLVQKKFDIPFKYSLTEYDRRIAELAGECYVEALKGLENGTLIPRPQGNMGKCIARRVEADDYRDGLDKMTSKDAFHFLYGTDGISKVYHSVLFDYNIGEPREDDKNKKMDIRCKDGYIPVSKSFNIKKCIFKLGGVF